MQPEEYYYDSLDEEDCTKDSPRLKKESKKKLKISGSEDVIPFYNGNVHRHDILHLIPQSERKLKQNKKVYNPYNKKFNSNSYLSLSKSQSNSGFGDSWRNDEQPEKEDYHNMTTNEEDCNSDRNSDSSFKESKVSDINEFSYFNVPKCTSDISLISEFKSVSEQFLVKGDELQGGAILKKCPGFTNVPVLGGLGADIRNEKLEVFRKRQMYGKTVSEKNRIKLEENKVLQKISHQIKLSKLVIENDLPLTEKRHNSQ